MGLLVSEGIWSNDDDDTKTLLDGKVEENNDGGNAGSPTSRDLHWCGGSMVPEI